MSTREGKRVENRCFAPAEIHAGRTESGEIVESMDEAEFLQAYDSSIYEKPSVAVDILIFTVKDDKLKIYLREREEMPQKGMLALPGVIVGIGESLDEAVERCLLDKAGFSGIYFEQLYTWGAVDRDPRMRMISVSYMAMVPFDTLEEKSRTDITAWLFNVDGLDKIKDRLAFDHGQMIACGRERIRNKTEYTKLAFEFVPEIFTLPQLQRIYEILLGKALYKANFRKKVLPMLTETGEYTKGDSHRPSMLYRQGKDTEN